MSRVTTFLGPPGTGKTTTLLKLVSEAIESGTTDPAKIGYFAFTKQAQNEAVTRAVSQHGIDEERLKYFRTIHSVAFRELGLTTDAVMSIKEFRAFGEAMGLTFRGVYEDDDNLPSGIHFGNSLGDLCATVCDLARVSLRSIEEQWRICSFPDLTLHAVKQYASALQRFKDANNLIDFSGMLEQCRKEVSPLDLDLVIIDEAQDLSALQWSTAIQLSRNASRVVLAGDDDQGIFGFAGAQSSALLGLDSERKVLPTSWRVPRSVHKIALSILSRIRGPRLSKEWDPRDAQGSVEHTVSESEIDFSYPGSWLCLARTNYQLHRYVSVLRQQGVPYMLRGRSSLDSDEARAVLAWEALRKGNKIPSDAARGLVRFMAHRPRLNNQELYSIEDLGLPEESKEIDWMDMLSLMNPEDREYLRSCLYRGAKFSAKPAVRVSTVHQAKGSQAESVVIIPETTKTIFNEADTDSEHRVWYTGVTRSSDRLFLVRPRGRYHYEV